MSVVITGAGAICGAGASPAAIVDAALEGRSAIAGITSFDATGWPRRHAAEVTDYNAAKLVGDRKLLKLIRRSDVFGLYAADQAIGEAGIPAYRDALEGDAAVAFAEATGCYVGSGGGAFNVNYDFFPLMADSRGDMQAFGRELGSTVNPMWLLRTLPNNVLCHVGIRHSIKGPNACITNHTTSGILAVLEGAEAIRDGEAWILGVVRRMQRGPAEEVTVGVEIVARRLVRVLMRTWSAPADDGRAAAERPFFGLYIPAHGENRQSAQRSLVGPDDKFSPGAMIELDTGSARYLVRFTQMLERQAGWSWALFSAVRKLSG